ncbi:MAG: hypothetical protein FRX48_01571 [Lasallia pustulata]|uniref:SPX domain-containing protein n=1 Tax=Lasallia pustulata TaxID=136370 RepID=A0A5M8PYJ7_9LECA|nr:MAG: hypothetical protein FRX48_01571 [Lasallia pustulata]
MKFSHSIQFNAVPDWSSHYISYSNLKKLIYTLEKSINQASAPQSHDPEISPLLDGNSDPDTVFRRALDNELEKICSFYQLKELEIYGEVSALMKDRESYEADTEGLDQEQTDGPPGSRSMNKGGRARQGSIFKSFGFGRPRRNSTLSASIHELPEDGDSDDDIDETAALTKSRSPGGRRKTMDMSASLDMDDMRSSRQLPKKKRTSSQAYEDYSDQVFSALYGSGITLKKRTVSLYVSLCELKSFIQLNKTGFSKALKKFDKTLDRNLRNKYINEAVTPAHPFKPTTMQHLDENIAHVEKMYADVVTKGDLEQARKELRLHLREHVVWERNTVWREMIGIERKAQAANMGLRRTLLGQDDDPSKARLQGDEEDNMAMKELVTPVGRFTCPKWLFSSTFFALLAILVVFIVLLVVPIMKNAEQQNCLAMLVFVSLLWATEVIPLFVTSLLVPFLVVVLQVVRSDQSPPSIGA